MDALLLTISSALYFWISLTITTRILGYIITKKLYAVIDVCLTMILFISAFILPEGKFSLLCAVFHLIQVLLIYLSIPKLKLISVIALYSLIYSFISIMVAALNSIIVLSLITLTVIEFVFHIIFAALIIFLCYNDMMRYKIQQIVFNIPQKIIILTVFALSTSTTLIALILSNPQMYVQTSWSVSVRIALIFFTLFICTTFPVLIITVLTNTYLKKQNESFERELQAQAEHYVALAESNEELRRFKHDFKNLRIGIAKALTSGDCEIALEMIENGQNDFIQATDNIIRFNTGNGIVDAILSEKQKKAADSNTVIVFEGRIPQTGFSSTDLCVIFGNTLDNAVEAYEKIREGENKIISVSVNCTGGFIFIAITNPVSEKVIVHNNHIETTKKDRASHGFGLYSIQKVAKKYNGEINILAEEHLFTITLDLLI